MEIKEFIKEVIVQIDSGLNDAKAELKREVLPITPYTTSGATIEKISNNECEFVADIAFELCLEESENKDKSRGISVALAVFDVNAKNKNTNDKASLSKIKFTIPVVVNRYSMNSKI